MAYYFAVETTENSYEAVNIKKSERYRNLFSESIRPYECTLEEIDKFTTEYRNEKLLRDDLYFDKAIPWCHYNRPLSIIYKNGIEVRKVVGELLFADSKKYIENPNLVIEYIINKIKEKDISFLRKITSTLDKNSMEVYMISRLATAIDEKKQVDEKQISDTAFLLVQHCYLNVEGKLVLSSQIDYEKLHNTVAFIFEYEKELAKNNQYTRTKKPQ